MLPSSDHVMAAYLGPQGILSLEPGRLHPHLLVDCSTIDPITAREVAAAAAASALHPHASEAHGGQRSPHMIDAPVSGGVPGAQAGSLTFMVSEAWQPSNAS
jgi:3-hydroxyisobutyrate dehydrogenase